MMPVVRKDIVGTPRTNRDSTGTDLSSTVKTQVHFTIDEVEAEDRDRQIEQELFKCYAAAVRKTLAEVVREECYGCQVNHLTYTTISFLTTGIISLPSFSDLI